MTINEAIKVISDYIDDPLIVNKDEFIEAISLGGEALRRVKWHKEQHRYYELLPGETGE